MVKIIEIHVNLNVYVGIITAIVWSMICNSTNSG